MTCCDCFSGVPKTAVGGLKPPDLWIHDQVERRTSRASNSVNSGTEAAPSVAGSQGFNDDSCKSSSSSCLVVLEPYFIRETMRML